MAITLSSLLMARNNALAQSDKNSWLNELHRAIEESRVYDAAKVKRTDSLRRLTEHLTGNDLFDHYMTLRQEFASFNIDSSFYYSDRLQETAIALHDANKLMYARLKQAQVLLSAGMFKEVFELMATIDPSLFTSEQKAEFYSLKARSYFDVADYNGNNLFLRTYNERANQYIDSCLLLSSSNSYFFIYYTALKNIRANNWQTATRYFSKLVHRDSLPLHQKAVVYSTFSDVYIRRKMVDSAIILLTQAAIADIKSSTKETTAILHLADLLFRQGDIQNASQLIQKAALDAKSYGARQRMLQLGNVLPLIEAEKLAAVQKEKFTVTRYATIITASLLFLLALIITIVRQVRKLKMQQQQISDKNISLHRLLEEKEWLLREVHHRVKNNLQTITSLLESQSAYLRNDALEAVKDSQHRVHAMSLIHQKLYQPETTGTTIDMAGYIHDLVSYLKESFETGNTITFQMDTDNVQLDISLAIPLGLILNEAITNSVKYGFPNQRTGIIKIAVTQPKQNIIKFTVADNGIGLPEGFDPSKSKTLGLKLIKGLCDEIGAIFTYQSGAGVVLNIELETNKLSTN